jgi:hypothetical protein
LPLVPFITVFNTIVLNTKEEVLTALIVFSSLFSLPYLLITALNFKSSFLSFLLSLVLDCPTLNALRESIFSQPSVSPFITIISPFSPIIPGSLKVKRIKEKIVKKKNKILKL